MKSIFREVLMTLALAAIILLLLQTVIMFPPAIIPSGSMKPTLEIGQRLIVAKIVYTFREPKRGDVIVFNPPFESEGPLIKRIIGLPGESVEIKQGEVYIHKNSNVLLLVEPYIKEPPTYTFEGDPIPKDEYFVLGDNRNFSGDSHTGWTVKRKDIIGKAWLSIWPPDRWGLITNPLQEQPVS